MRRPLAALLLAACAAATLPAQAQQRVVQTDPRLARFFGTYKGCLVLQNLGTDDILFVNQERCSERLPPCSTFKIWHAMAGLETGVLADENTKFAWDGVKRPIAAWNQDHTLATAIRDSVVWYFQKVAAGIGEERMRFWMNEVPYGNRDITGGLDHFWLDSSLRISSNEQVDFLAKMYRGQLKFRPEVVDTVKRLIVLKTGSPSAVGAGLASEASVTRPGLASEASVTRPGLASEASVTRPGDVEFSGKTGSCEEGGTGRGWFVGHVKGPRGEYVFALNIEGPAGKANGREARRIVTDILTERRLM